MVQSTLGIKGNPCTHCGGLSMECSCTVDAQINGTVLTITVGDSSVDVDLGPILPPGLAYGIDGDGSTVTLVPGGANLSVDVCGTDAFGVSF